MSIKPKSKQNMKFYVVCRSILNTKYTDIQSEIRTLFEQSILPSKQELHSWMSIQKLVSYNSNEVCCLKNVNFSLQPDDSDVALKMKYYALCRYQNEIDLDEIHTELEELFQKEAPDRKELKDWINIHWKTNKEIELGLKINELEKALSNSALEKYKTDCEIKELKKEFDKLKDYNASNELEMNNLKYAIKRKQQEIDLLRIFEEKAVKYDSLKLELNKRDIKIRRLEDEVVMHVQAANNESNKVINQLEFKLVSKELDFKTLESRISDLNEKLSKLETSNQELKETNKQQEEMYNKLENNYNTIELNNLELKANLNEATRDLKELKQNNDALSKGKNEYERILNEKDDSFNNLNESFKTELAASQSQLTACKFQLMEHEKLESYLKQQINFHQKQAQQSLDELNSRLIKLTNEYDQSKASTSETIRLKNSQIIQLKNELNETNKSMNEIKFEKNFLIEQIDQIRKANLDYSIKNTNLNETVKRLQDEKETLNTKYNELIKTNEKIEDDIKKTLLMLNEKDRFNLKQTEEITSLKVSLNEVSIRISELSKEKETLTSKINEKSDEIVRIHAEACLNSLVQTTTIHELKESVKCLDDDKTKLNQNINELEKELNQKEIQLKDKKNQIEESLAKIKILFSEKKYLEEEQEYIKESNFKYSCANKILNEKNTLLENELNELKIQMENLTKEIQETKENFESLIQDYAKKEQELHKKQLEINNLKVDLNVSLLQIDNLKSNVDALKFKKTKEVSTNTINEKQIKRETKKCLDELISRLSKRLVDNERQILNKSINEEDDEIVLSQCKRFKSLH